MSLGMQGHEGTLIVLLDRFCIWCLYILPVTLHSKMQNLWRDNILVKKQNNLGHMTWGLKLFKWILRVIHFSVFQVIKLFLLKDWLELISLVKFLLNNENISEIIFMCFPILNRLIKPTCNSSVRIKMSDKYLWKCLGKIYTDDWGIFFFSKICN